MEHQDTPKKCYLSQKRGKCEPWGFWGTRFLDHPMAIQPLFHHISASDVAFQSPFWKPEFPRFLKLTMILRAHHTYPYIVHISTPCQLLIHWATMWQPQFTGTVPHHRPVGSSTGPPLVDGKICQNFPWPKAHLGNHFSDGSPGLVGKRQGNVLGSFSSQDFYSNKLVVPSGNQTLQWEIITNAGLI